MKKESLLFKIFKDIYEVNPLGNYLRIKIPEQTYIKSSLTVTLPIIAYVEKGGDKFYTCSVPEDCINLEEGEGEVLPGQITVSSYDSGNKCLSGHLRLKEGDCYGDIDVEEIEVRDFIC